MRDSILSHYGNVVYRRSSAATGRTVSVSYATANFSAFGGATCSVQGAGYEIKSGSFTFQPGTTTFPIPVRFAATPVEANETFRVQLSNATGATILLPQGVGTIVNDDVA